MGIKVVEGYKRPEKVNPYIADLKGITVGTTFEVEVETRLSENSGKVLGLTGEKSAVQEGARANGVTARLQEAKTISEPEAGKPGKTVYIFTVFPLQESGPRKPREGSDTSK